MEFEPFEVIEAPDVDPLSRRVSGINQEIMHLKSESRFLRDPDNSDRIDTINQRIIMLEIERDQLFKLGAQ
jgi:hypothetical protein